MAKKKETKQSPTQRLFVYAGKYKYLTIASWILAAISAFVALVPFYFIWRIIKEVLYVAPNMQMQKICRLMDGVRLDLRYCPCLSISEL